MEDSIERSNLLGATFGISRNYFVALVCSPSISRLVSSETASSPLSIVPGFENWLFCGISYFRVNGTGCLAISLIFGGCGSRCEDSDKSDGMGITYESVSIFLLLDTGDCITL